MFKLNNHLKAQVILYDCMFAVFIFIIVLGAFMIANNNNYETGERLIMMNGMKALAHNAIETLVSSEGKPVNWNRDNVEIIGLGQGKGILSKKKVQELQEMSYENINALLIFGKGNFMLQIDSKNDADDLTLGEGIDDKNSVIMVERNVLYGGANANVKLFVFE